MYSGRLMTRFLRTDFKLTRGDTNVVHMTLRPSDSGEDDMTQRSANPKSERRGASCRCVIL